MRHSRTITSGTRCRGGEVAKQVALPAGEERAVDECGEAALTSARAQASTCS
jgi:hypothetical protein